MQNYHASSARSSVDRALDLLVLLREGPIGVAQAADRIEVSRPTASRLLATLGRHGFAVQGPDRRYRPGEQLIGSSASSVSRNELRTVLRPSLVAVHERLGETVNLWLLEGVFVRNLDGIETSELLSISASARDRVPAYCSAAGKAMLATYSNHEVERMHANGLPPWRSHRPNGIQGLKRHLQTVRSRGYATNLEESSQGVFGVGVAVLGLDGVAVAGIGCGVPAVRYSAVRGREIAADLKSAATDMSEVIGSFARGARGGVDGR